MRFRATGLQRGEELRDHLIDLAALRATGQTAAEGSTLLHLGVFDRPDGHAYGDLAGLVALTDRFFEIVRQLLFEGHRAWGRRLWATGASRAGCSSCSCGASRRPSSCAC